MGSVWVVCACVWVVCGYVGSVCVCACVWVWLDGVPACCRDVVITAELRQTTRLPTYYIDISYIVINLTIEK